MLATILTAGQGTEAESDVSLALKTLNKNSVVGISMGIPHDDSINNFEMQTIWLTWTLAC